ncbi:MAG: Gfo/Idh/MocA family oxidoreductase [Verrucomicrobia bacterium]|nr:Gfo/Idh/MocA family oxidoreductase [Verrucomicrobiota bacterium]MBI3869930.1 Gfo/Idh/MocA family oxidoreductase [Verrucomicrobiota bacterium]
MTKPSLLRSRNRRDFLRVSLAASIAFPLVSSRNVLGANKRLNIAAIGAGGKGGVDIGYCKAENVVALCDVDQNNAAASFKAFPNAKRFKDFRKMLEEMGSGIDAVTVSTPDHTHFHAAAMAMSLGKHVYVQKPLTHTIWEARQLTQLARRKRVVTQMGNQGHSEVSSRRLVELIKGGVLGEVKEAHVWTNRPIWPQGMSRPKEAPAPAHLDWDLWLGPAPYRPYHEGCVPFNWRAFWDFGTGALGDMGCHNMDLAFFALDLRNPKWVEANSSGLNPETAPAWSTIRYHFNSGGRDGMDLHWYDGGKKPDPALVKEKSLPENGCILVGARDTLYVPSYWGRGSFMSGAKMEDHAQIPQRYPRLPGADKDNDAAQHQEWIQACKGEGRTLSHFGYAGPMTEAVLLGNVALRAGKRIEWDAAAMKVKNAPEANQFIKTEYRKGWESPI